MGHRWNPFLRFPRLSLLATLLLCLPWWAKVGQLRVRSEIRILLEGDQRNLEGYEKVREILAEEEVAVISLELPEIFSRDGLSAVRRVSDAFERQPGVTEVKSLTHSVRPVRRGLSFEMIPLVPVGSLTGDQLSELKTFALEHPLVRNVMIAADGRHTIITVNYRRSLRTGEERRAWRSEIDDILKSFRAEGMKFQVLAVPLIEEEIGDSLRADAVRLLPAALIVLIGVLWFTFRSWRYVGVILAQQVAVVLILPGVLQQAGFSLTVFSIMLLPLLMGIHLTLLTHVGSSLQRARSEGQEGLEAIDRMLQEVFSASVFASLTTVAGLGSLLLSDVPQIREFGVMGCLGMALVFGMTFGPGLALFRWLASMLPGRGRAGTRAESTLTDASLESTPEAAIPADWAWVGTRFIRKRARVILILALVAGLAGALGWTRVRTDIRAVEFLGHQSPTRQALESLDEVYGGINVVRIEFDSGSANGIQGLEFLRYLELVRARVADQAGVSGVYSYAQLLAMMNQIWEGGGPETMELPDSPLLIQGFVLALRSQNFPFLTTLADSSFRTAYLILRTRDMPADQYLDLLHDTVDFAVSRAPRGVTVSATEGLHSILEANRRIVRSQVRTAGMALVVIFVVLTLLWRSPGLALLSVGINVLPVGVVLGVAGLAQAPLNAITVMVAAIALGIAVDDSVHFLTYWRRKRRGVEDSSKMDALMETLRVKGRPITATSAALITIFALFVLSSFPPVRDFGILGAVAFAGAWVSVMVLLPALLSLGTARSSDQRSAISVQS